jgi:hypothetical protein
MPAAIPRRCAIAPRQKIPMPPPEMTGGWPLPGVLQPNTFDPRPRFLQTALVSRVGAFTVAVEMRIPAVTKRSRSFWWPIHIAAEGRSAGGLKDRLESLRLPKYIREEHAPLFRAVSAKPQRLRGKPDISLPHLYFPVEAYNGL